MANDASVASGRMYVMARSGRLFPDHGFTSGLIIRKRFEENTTPLAISVGLVLPTLVELNRRLDEYVVNGIELTFERTLEILAETVKGRFIHYADELSRVVVQTCVCCVLLRQEKPYSGGAVYLWDMYPRLHQHYVAELVAALKLPPFLATIVGRKPSEMDLQVYREPIPALAALEDSFKRNTILLVGDVVVDTVSFFIKRYVNPKHSNLSQLASQAASRVIVTVFRVVGAAAGRQVGGARGEYWGEVVGTITAPLAFTQITLLLFASSRRSVTTGSGGGERRRRSRSRDTREDSSRISTRSTPLDKRA